ncbi:hypothetical protein LV89_01060 [Arcicella aurantiaca]|uniref:Uncharacterized protein n=1 Tax=Arcicella aurantiaca TaxID=591202 RepID=A0A316EBQ4_9BACT|nr:hypothetical protein [Arcicella aurantiaca]PWK28277.1 hypothetical protein LV89_01060 [Arcicella aurantiaca]
MTTLEINILDDESLILDVLRAFEQRHLLIFTNKKSYSFSGKKMEEMEYEDMLNEARKTPAYSLEQAKKYLNL